MPCRPPLRFSPLSLLAFLGMVSACASTRASGDDLAGLEVPPGFEISLYANDALAHDIYSLTIDSQGRVVVAGAGYVKTLHDDDGDGRADRSTLYSSIPASGAKGMVFDGPDLICTGDNAVMRLRDVDGDGAADGSPEIWTNLRHPEHGANGIVRGPDGCYYVICGNDAGVSTRQITTDCSPVANPRSGAVVRLAADGRPLDVTAHGFRNPYDLDFNAAGHLFTVDSDGERDHHLPWYAPTRLFDIAPGGEHGWLLMGWMRGWNRPPSFFDNVERLAEIGRGSPTGLAVYRHHAFGPHYAGGVFSACWSLGRIYFLPLSSNGSTYRSQAETFVKSTGSDGFAPCDLAIGPGGDMFIAMGGRRTKGSVFRVRATTPAVDASDVNQRSEVQQVLDAPQPLTSWSRARWKPLAEKLGVGVFQNAAEDESNSLDERLRAIEIVVELCGGPDLDWAARVAAGEHAALRARIAWAMGRAGHLEGAQQTLMRLTSDSDPVVTRAAWEGLLSADNLDPQAAQQPDWLAGLSSADRRVRFLAVLVAQRAGAKSYQEFCAAVRRRQPASSSEWRFELADLWIRRPDVIGEQPPSDNEELLKIARCVQANVVSDPVLALEGVRLLQIGLGDLRTQERQAEVYSGYVGNLTEKIDTATRHALATSLAPLFPTSDAELNRELARLLGMLAADAPKLLPAIASRWTTASSVEDDIHYLIVASLLPGPRDAAVTDATARALLALHPKLAALEQFASRNWPLRVGEAFDELCRRDRALAEVLVANETFGNVEHTLFAERLTPPLREQAAHRLWNACCERGVEPTSELVALVGRLPNQEAYPLLVEAWDLPGLRDTAVRALAKHPREIDRAKFVAALASADPIAVEAAAEA